MLVFAEGVGAIEGMLEGAVALALEGVIVDGAFEGRFSFAPGLYTQPAMMSKPMVPSSRIIFICELLHEMVFKPGKKVRRVPNFASQYKGTNAYAY